MAKDNNKQGDQHENNAENLDQQEEYSQQPNTRPMPEPKKSSGMGIIIFVIVVGLVMVIDFKEHIFNFLFSHKHSTSHQEVSKPLLPEPSSHSDTPTHTANNSSISAPEKQEIENIVKDYIQNNPEVILGSLKNMEQKVAKERSAKAEDYIKNNISSINANKPYLGNKNGTLIIPKFFDYKCGYCKKAHSAIETLVKNTPNLKVNLIELPIMGPQSLIATQASLAVFSIAPTKFAKFNSDLMALPNIDENAIKTLATQHNINVTSLMSAMKSSSVEQSIDANMSIAREVGLQGVPAFIIGDEFIPGFIDYNALKAKIEKLQTQQRGS